MLSFLKQGVYELFAFIEFIEGIDYNSNHYVSYKLINGRWLKYDDEEVELLQDIEARYRCNLLFFRFAERTLPYTLSIGFPDEPLPPSPRRQRACKRPRTSTGNDFFEH